MTLIYADGFDSYGGQPRRGGAIPKAKAMGQETLEGMSAVHFLDMWGRTSMEQLREQQKRSVYAVRGGAIVEWFAPPFHLKFPSLRLVRVFVKSHKVEWKTLP